MYVFGGVKTLNSSKDVRSNDIFRMWLTQPSLAEMCWEVISACLQCNKVLLSEARKLGIPHHFLKRVLWKTLLRATTVHSLVWTLRVIRLVVLKIFTDIKLHGFFYNLCHLARLLICTIARIEVPYTQNVIHVTKCTIDSQYQSLDCIFKFSGWY